MTWAVMARTLTQQATFVRDARFSIVCVATYDTEAEASREAIDFTRRSQGEAAWVRPWAERWA